MRAALSKNEAVSFPELGSEVPVFLALQNKRWILPMLDLPAKDMRGAAQPLPFFFQDSI